MTFYKSKSWLHILILLAVIFASRSFLINAENAILNGDECILGLMGKHFLEGRELPIYFYGQSYGFSLVEVLFISISFAIGGISASSVNVAMLILWSTGIVFLYLLLSRVSDSKRNRLLPFLVSLLFVLSPAWFNFSMQARGGYITAFSLSFLLLLLLRIEKGKKLKGILTGVITMVIFESQPLWILPLIPLIVTFIFKYQRRSFALLYAMGWLITFGIFKYIKMGLPSFWRPSIFKFDFETLTTNLLSLGDKIESNLSGLYYLEKVKDAPLLIDIFSLLFIILLTLSLFNAIWKIIKKRNAALLDMALIASVAASLIIILFVDHFAPRYLLPFSCFAILLIFNFLKGRSVLQILTIIGPLILIGSLSLVQYTKVIYPENEKVVIEELISELDNQNVAHVFTTGPLLQWQLMFYSDEKLTCRFRSKTDRYPDYVLKVNQAFKDQLPTALVSKKERLKSDRFDYATRQGAHVIIFNPSSEELTSNKFRF